MLEGTKYTWSLRNLALFYATILISLLTYLLTGGDASHRSHYVAPCGWAYGRITYRTAVRWSHSKRCAIGEMTLNCLKVTQSRRSTDHRPTPLLSVNHALISPILTHLVIYEWHFFHFSSIDSPLSSSITPSLFHSRLKIFLFLQILPIVASFSSSGLTPQIPRNVYRYSEADDRMFNGVVINPEHVLHQFLTEREVTYNLRRRPHGRKTLLTKTQSLNEQDFFIRAMYKHSY